MNPMRNLFLSGALAGLALGLLSLSCSGQTNTNQTVAARGPARNSYDAFRLISQRNIFNPNRSMAGAAPVARASAPPAVRIESFSLLGTMQYEKGNFAFFDGTSSRYKMVAKPS